ncbi:hypothetical protein AXX16_4332 [Serratia rubidaea]|nr:hypothetical protein AXX16_4332 [Serratia rubidaea]
MVYLIAHAMHPLRFLLTVVRPYRQGRLAAECDSFKNHQKNHFKFMMIKINT